MADTNIIVALFGASGTGKTTFADYLVEHDNFSKIKTMTTRPKRTPDEDDYHFVNEKEFKHQIKLGRIFAGTYFDHHYYGSNLADIGHLFKTGHHKAVIILTWSGVVHYVAKFKGSNIRVYPVELYAQSSIALQRINARSDSHMTKHDVLDRMASYREQARKAEQSPINSYIINSYPRHSAYHASLQLKNILEK